MKGVFTLKKKYDRHSHGITFEKNAFMIDGYIEDYSLDENESPCFLDLLDNKGYVDEDGKIWIYKEIEPDNSSMFGIIPWFTVIENDEKRKYKFSKRKLKDVDDAFDVKNIGDLSFKNISKNIKEDDKLYDEDVLNDLNASTTIFKPEIKDTDDFLKKLIKEIIIRKAVNIAKYLPKVPKKYILSNWKQSLSNDSKTSAINFINWSELMGIDFHVIAYDNGTDTDKLKEVLHYDNRTDTIKVLSKQELEKFMQKIETEVTKNEKGSKK